MRHFGLSILLLVAALTLTACDKNVPLENVQNAPSWASQDASLEQMTAAIVAAGGVRGWTMTPQSPGTIRGDLRVRNKHSVSVDILYDAENFSIIYISSEGMNYRLRDGEPRIHPGYIRWIKYLKNDIQERTKTL